jgi:hypothetical protein
VSARQAEPLVSDTTKACVIDLLRLLCSIGKLQHAQPTALLLVLTKATLPVCVRACAACRMWRTKSRSNLSRWGLCSLGATVLGRITLQ